MCGGMTELTEVDVEAVVRDARAGDRDALGQLNDPGDRSGSGAGTDDRSGSGSDSPGSDSSGKGRSGED
jgi:hypothetical protein